MTPVDKYRSVNRDIWNRNAESNFRRGMDALTGEYPLQRFVNDSDHISEDVEFDRFELGDVSGKTLLHLQCHIGTDTLSWARLGATVTGVDLSDKSIELARRLSRDCGTPATFVEAELYDSPGVISEKFDIVYTGIGALCWIPDIRAWAKVVSGFLKPGGVFHLRDGHPVLQSLDENSDDEFRIVHPYLEAGGVMEFSEPITDGVDGELGHRTQYEWPHGLGEIVTALIDAGMKIEFVHEHTLTRYQYLPQMVSDKDGWWRLPGNENLFPLMFSIRATKEVV